jgi:chromosome segregation ATPase
VETPATELPVQEGDFPAVLVSQAEPVQVEGKPAHDADAIAELQASLETAEAGIANLMLAKDELLREIDFANRAADELRDAITTARGSTSTTDVIQQALESRKRQAEARGEVRAALTASGLDMKALARAAAKSPVDQALARKTGRGSARPAHR